MLDSAEVQFIPHGIVIQEFVLQVVGFGRIVVWWDFAEEVQKDHDTISNKLLFDFVIDRRYVILDLELSVWRNFHHPIVRCCLSLVEPTIQLTGVFLKGSLLDIIEIGVNEIVLGVICDRYPQLLRELKFEFN